MDGYQREKYLGRCAIVDLINDYMQLLLQCTPASRGRIYRNFYQGSSAINLPKPTTCSLA